MGYVLNFKDPSKCSNCCRLNFQKRSPLIRYMSFKNLTILFKSEFKTPLLISCYYLIWQCKITRKKGLYICSWVWYRRESLCKYELCMLLNPKYILFKGQLNLEWIYEVIVSPKTQTKNYNYFCRTIQTRMVALFFVIFWECRQFFWL